MPRGRPHAGSSSRVSRTDKRAWQLVPDPTCAFPMPKYLTLPPADTPCWAQQRHGCACWGHQEGSLWGHQQGSQGVLISSTHCGSLCPKQNGNRLNNRMENKIHPTTPWLWCVTAQCLESHRQVPSSLTGTTHRALLLLYLDLVHLCCFHFTIKVHHLSKKISDNEKMVTKKTSVLPVFLL